MLWLSLYSNLAQHAVGFYVWVLKSLEEEAMVWYNTVQETYQIFHQIWKLFGDNWKFLEGSANVIWSVIPDIFTHDGSLTKAI